MAVYTMWTSVDRVVVQATHRLPNRCLVWPNESLQPTEGPHHKYVTRARSGALGSGPTLTGTEPPTWRTARRRPPLADQPLHPNLARLAAAYDDITQRFARGQLTATQANSAIMALVARDDEGVHWSIDPSSGDWLRRTRTGDLVPGTPPSYGVATPTAHDLTHDSGGFNPDQHITFHAVDEGMLVAPGSLAGTTRGALEAPLVSIVDKVLPTTRHKVVAGVAAVVLLFVAWNVTSDGDDGVAPVTPPVVDTTPLPVEGTTPAAPVPAPTSSAPTSPASTTPAG